MSINGSDHKNIKELWTSAGVSFDNKGFTATVPAKDVRLYRLEKSSWVESVDVTKKDVAQVDTIVANNNLVLKANHGIKKVDLFSTDGSLLFSKMFNSRNTNEQISIANYAQGTYLVHVLFETGEMVCKKVLFV